MKKKKRYLPPRAVICPLELEGLICQSGLTLGVQVDEIHNMNADIDADADDFYFEF